MSKFIVVTFPNEAKAYEGVSALNKLHSEGSITLYDTAVAQRGADGKLVAKQRTAVEGIDMGVGALVGALIGAFAGPVGAAIGLATGTTVGSIGGYVHGEVSDEFLEDVTKAMRPGTFALLAEISEPWAAPVDTQMEALGGRVLRETRKDVIGDVMEKRAEARRAFFDEKKAAHHSRKAQSMEAKLEVEIEDAADKLRRTAEKAHQRLDHTKQELDAKLKTLQEQATKAKPDVKRQIDERIAEIRQDFGEREKKLSHAYEVAQQALH